MSSFKKKLREILDDSTTFKSPSNNDEKLGHLMKKTFRKIKRDNSRHSLYRNNSTKDININKLFPQKIDYFLIKQNKRITPKTAANMIQTLSLLKNHSRNYYKGANYKSMTKYLNDSSIIKQKLKRNINYLNKDISNLNHTYKICNRPITSFTSFNKNLNKSINKNTTIFNLKQINNKKSNNLINNKDDFFNDNDKDILKKSKSKLNDECFNQFIKKQKNKIYSYSRKNNANKYYTRFNF